MTLPRFVVKGLQLEHVLSPILTALREIMGTPSPALRTHNIVFVPVGSESQDWHYDDKKLSKGSKFRYFTILIHLNALDDMCGGTEVRLRTGGRLKSDLVRNSQKAHLLFKSITLMRLLLLCFIVYRYAPDQGMRLYLADRLSTEVWRTKVPLIGSSTTRVSPAEMIIIPPIYDICCSFIHMRQGEYRIYKSINI